MTTEVAHLTATELLAAYEKKELSPVEATQAALDRIAAVDEQLNAYCLVDADSALGQARESEQRWQRGEPAGPVDGVPTSVKDMFLTRGWPTLRGSRTVDADQKWEADAPCVARLRESGAVLVGKTTTPELGWKGVTDNPLTGVTRNPWDLTRTPGGSSGGSSAAVAAGMAPLSVGTDGGGSVRIPGAFSGIFALKPTYGRIPLYPSSPFGTLAHAGPMTWTVDDGALLLDVISAHDARDWSELAPPVGSFVDALGDGVQGLRIAFSPDLGFVDVHPEVAAAVRDGVAAFGAAGAHVEEASPGFADPVETFNVLWYSGAAKFVEPLTDEQRGLLDPGLREICAQGATYSALDYLEATAQRMALGVAMGECHENYDLLVTPTMPIPAFTAGREVPEDWSQPRWTSWSPFTYPFNLTQQPAATVPCGFTASGLPIGLQIVGPRHADAAVLAAAKAFQDAKPWTATRPTLES
ncbi:MAG: amidase [Streptosporangiales bacterium]|nr:amidase [Streptosporangiales bacterium]